jgi:hypothetical protein
MPHPHRCPVRAATRPCSWANRNGGKLPAENVDDIPFPGETSRMWCGSGSPAGRNRGEEKGALWTASSISWTRRWSPFTTQRPLRRSNLHSATSRGRKGPRSGRSRASCFLNDDPELVCRTPRDSQHQKIPGCRQSRRPESATSRARPPMGRRWKGPSLRQASGRQKTGRDGECCRSA